MNFIEQVQSYLQEKNICGWLLYDFQGKNFLARHVLKIGSHQMTTRRFFYWIPKKGAPVKIVHAIEAEVLDSLPGEKKLYSSWQSLEKELKKLLQEAHFVAMEYSPKNRIPYVSLVDGGTLELIGSFGPKVVSSSDFLPYFTAVLSQEQIKSHQRAAKALDQIAMNTWNWIRQHLQQHLSFTEYDVQQSICKEFEKRDLIADHPPIVAVNAHSADPHYEPLKERSAKIKEGDFILIDLWAKEKGKESIYADITRVAIAAKKPTAKQQEIFHLVRKAQLSAVELIKDRFKEKKRIEGWEVDEAARSVIREAGFERYFIHRTGHNIERNLHGSGAHMDNLETHDVRPLLPNTCFSIEPGIYLPQEFGVRLEFDLLIHENGSIEISGGEQTEIYCIYTFHWKDS